jgi:hypothetical protein
MLAVVENRFSLIPYGINYQTPACSTQAEEHHGVSALALEFASSHFLHPFGSRHWKNASSMRCFILSRLTYAVVKVLLDIKSNHQSHLAIPLTVDPSPASYQLKTKTSLILRMTGSWGLQRTHLNHTPKSLNS